jgi:hypothetical protein
MPTIFMVVVLIRSHKGAETIARIEASLKRGGHHSFILFAKGAYNIMPGITDFSSTGFL